MIIDGNPTPGRLSTVALVFEYLDHDLSGLLDTPEAASQITPALAKSYMMQLVEGVRVPCARCSVVVQPLGGTLSGTLSATRLCRRHAEGIFVAWIERLLGGGSCSSTSTQTTAFVLVLMVRV